MKRFTIELAKLGARVTVGDISPRQLEINCQKCRPQGLTVAAQGLGTTSRTSRVATVIARTAAVKTVLARMKPKVTIGRCTSHRCRMPTEANQLLLQTMAYVNVARERVWLFVVVLPLLLAVASSPGSPRTSVSATQAPVTPGADIPVAVQEVYGVVGLSFEANEGQTDEEVEFLSRGRGYTLFLTPTEAVLVLTKLARQRGNTVAPPNPPTAEDTQQSIFRMQLLRRVLGNELNTRAISRPTVTGLDQLPGKSNYFIGNTQKWLTNIPHYARVHYQKVYRGVDLVYSANRRQLEYEFIVAAGADPEVIRLGFEDLDRLFLDTQGNLILRSPLNSVEFILNAPIIYQEIDGVRKAITGGYVKKSTRTIGFRVAAYDAERPLVIHYSAYLGDRSSRVVNDIALDSAGNIYLAGETCLIDFPESSVPYFCSDDDSDFVDAFVTKIEPAREAIVYSTYIRGNAFDSGRSIAVDVEGAAYVTGETSSTDFPRGVEGFPRNRSISRSVGTFVTKLDAEGVLVYSSPLEGFGGRGIAVDAEGNAYLTYVTSGSIVSKVDREGHGLDYSTPIGFVVNDIAVNADGIAFVTGGDCSGIASSCVARVLGLNSDGESVYFNRVFEFEGIGNGITVDTAGKVYVTGETRSCEFLTLNAIQRRCGRFEENVPNFIEEDEGHSSDAIVMKLDPRLGRIVYSTYLGGDGDDFGNSIAVDVEGNAYITGTTKTLIERASPPKDFPTENPWQAENGGEFDVFVAKLNPDGSALDYSTFLGSKDGDASNAIAVDTIGNSYVVGYTESADLLAADPLQSIEDSFRRGLRVFVAKLGPSADLSITRAASSDAAVASTALNYNLIVTNKGPSDAVGIILTDALSAGVSFVSATPTHGSCGKSGNIVQCNLGKLTSGDSATVTIQVTIDPSTTGTITHKATVTTAVVDPHTGNNMVTGTTNVMAPPTPELVETRVPMATPTPETATVLLNPTATPVPPAAVQPTSTTTPVSPTETPTPAITSTPQPAVTPAQPVPSQGGCTAPAGGPKALDAGWLLVGLAGPGLALARWRSRVTCLFNRGEPR